MTDTGPIIDLTDAADRVRLRPGDVDAVVARARHRTRRRRQAVGVLAAVALVASVPAAQRVLSPEEEGTPVAASGGAVQRGTLGLTWREVEPRTALGFARGLSTGSPVYGISSAPGERMVDGREPSRVVWRSDDGVDWTVMTSLGPDLFLSDLSPRDGRVYAVGTAPAEAVAPGRAPTLRSSELVVGWSDDGGKGWKKTALPFDFPTERVTRSGGIVSPQVAAGPKGVVAVAAMHAQLDIHALLPDGVTAPHGWATTATGVDVLGPPRGDVCPEGYIDSRKQERLVDPPTEVPPTWCYLAEDEATITIPPQQTHSVEASYTFEQLGVGGDLLRAVRRELVAFYAEPGSTEFRRMDLPDVAGVGGGIVLHAGDDGFTVLTSSMAQFGGRAEEIVVLRSPDGRAWTKATRSEEGRWPVALGTLAGRTAYVTGGEGTASLAVADGNGGWTSRSLEGALDPAVVGDRVVNASTAAFGPFGVALHVVLIPKEHKPEEPEVVHRLLVSRDGETWDDIALDDVLGTPGGYVSRLTITDEQVVVTGSLPTPGKPEGPRRQVVVVGAPS